MQLTIFAGVTGFDKTSFLKKFVRRSLKDSGYNQDIQSSDAQRFIQYIKFEDELLKEYAVSSSIPDFLNKFSFKEKTDVIERTFTRIGKKTKETRSDHVFLDIHLSYLHKSEYLPPLNTSNFSELVLDEIPIKVITFIDDVFVIHNNLRAREESYPNTKLRLREILAWRSVEMLQAESLALNYTNENRAVRNYLVSIRHPYETFSNLIFKYNPITAYISYPISRTRQIQDCVSDINKARVDLHSLFASNGASLFDPVTIDELALNKLEGSGTVTLNSDDRWPLMTETLTDEPKYPMEFSQEEISEAMPDIENQIRSRDFKLVDNARFTAVYRPVLGGFSTGVNTEINYTISQGKRVYVYNPKSDSRTQSHNPFDPNCVTIQDYETFKEDLKKYISFLGNKS